MSQQGTNSLMSLGHSYRNRTKSITLKESIIPFSSVINDTDTVHFQSKHVNNPVRSSGGGGGGGEGYWSIPLKSITTILNEIMTALKQPNIVIVGIYGTSSANKKNAVEIVKRRVERDELFNVVVETRVKKKPNLETIQEELGNAIGLQLHDNILEKRATHLHDKIKMMKEKMLIILDDLHGEINLDKIGIPSGDVHKDCKILLVAENIEVLSDKMKIQTVFSVDN